MAVSRISVRQETREEAFVFLEQYRIEDLKQFVFFSYAYKTVSLRAPQPQRGGVEEAYVEPSGILKLRGPNWIWNDLQGPKSQKVKRPIL